MFTDPAGRGAFAGNVRAGDAASRTIRCYRNRSAGNGVPVVPWPKVVAGQSATRGHGSAIGGITPILAALIEGGVALLLQGLRHAIASVQTHG
jgi:hypothetical protein